MIWLSVVVVVVYIGFQKAYLYRRLRAEASVFSAAFPRLAQISSQGGDGSLDLLSGQRGLGNLGLEVFQTSRFTSTTRTVCLPKSPDQCNVRPHIFMSAREVR